MKNISVKDIMVPLKDYARIPERATLFEAVQALAKAQQDYDQSRDHHRAILVYDNQNKIVGKLSQLDILKALEPNYRMFDIKNLSRFGYGLDYLRCFAEAGLWEKPLADICSKAATLIVKDFMYTPQRGEYIIEEAGLDEAIHQLIIGQYRSLLVTRGEDIVGILRLTDVFALVSLNISQCEI